MKKKDICFVYKVMVKKVWKNIFCYLCKGSFFYLFIMMNVIIILMIGSVLIKVILMNIIVWSVFFNFGWWVIFLIVCDMIRLLLIFVFNVDKLIVIVVVIIFKFI